ncbi:MAG: transposase [Chloroflexi bacterium]|nr:transposase [Chloroflexota bacterium]
MRVSRGLSQPQTRACTATLFAALGVATRMVQTGRYPRSSRRTIVDFLDEVARGCPGRRIRVLVDSLSTYRPRHGRWLVSHPEARFQFMPTHASWVNQVERWFSIMPCGAASGASLIPPHELRYAVERFLSVHNKAAAPFEWTKTVV